MEKLRLGRSTPNPGREVSTLVKGSEPYKDAEPLSPSIEHSKEGRGLRNMAEGHQGGLWQCSPASTGSM